MRKKLKTILAGAFVTMIALTGCSSASGNSEQGGNGSSSISANSEGE